MHCAVCLIYLQVILFVDTIFFFPSEGENSECEEWAVIDTCGVSGPVTRGMRNWGPRQLRRLTPS